MGTQYCHLSSSERVRVEVFAMHGASHAAIGRAIGRHRSTVMRECRRGHMALGIYLAEFGERYYSARRARAGFLRRKLGPDLTSPAWRCIRRGLTLGWSPEQIAAVVRSPDPAPGPWVDHPLSICHETIYRAIYDLPPSPQRRDLVKLLRQSRAGRRKRHRGQQRFVGLLDITPISERPEVINARRQGGHWEGDLLEGARGTPTVICTLVERVSRLVRLVKLPNATSLTMLRGVRRELAPVPSAMCRSLTYDRGTEMAQHKKLAKSLDIKIYFCDAYSPWQRGTNENTNGLLRQYLPKGMDLGTVSPRRLARIERLLNNRPRKVLDFRTPLQVYDQLILKRASR